MTTISVSAPLTTASVEGLLQTLLERFETLRMDQPKAMRVPMQAEIRSLDFWRSIVAECLATFFLIFIICGAAIPWAGHTPPPFAIALAAGFAIASLTLCFSHVSGPFIICQLILQLRPRSLSNSLWDDGGNFFCSPPPVTKGNILSTLSGQLFVDRFSFRLNHALKMMHFSIGFCCIVMFRCSFQSGGNVSPAGNAQSLANQSVPLHDSPRRRGHSRSCSSLRVSFVFV